MKRKLILQMKAGHCVSKSSVSGWVARRLVEQGLGCGTCGAILGNNTRKLCAIIYPENGVVCCRSCKQLQQENDYSMEEFVQFRKLF